MSLKDIDRKRIKVLYVQAFAGGGSLIALYEMLRQMDKAVIDPVVLCYYKNQYTVKLEDLAGCKVIYLPDNENDSAATGTAKKYKKLPGIITAQKNILKQYFLDDRSLVHAIYTIIKTENPDIVHHNNDVFANSPDIRAASKAHVSSIIHNRSLPDYKNNLIRYLLDFFLVRKAAFRINITEAVKKRHDHLFHLSSESSVVVNDFIDISKYKLLSETNSFRQELEISNDGFLITNIGRITNWKGQHILIEAIELIKTKLRNFMVLMVGSYEKGIGSEKYYNYLRQLVGKYNLEHHVCFTGNREDISRIMHASDVIVHSSVKPEPQGLVIIEALLCDKLVIASNAGGSAEIINKYGGILVEPGDAAALAQILLDVYDNYKNGQHNGNVIRHEKLVSDFNGIKQAQKIVDIYTKACKRSNK